MCVNFCGFFYRYFWILRRLLFISFQQVSLYLSFLISLSLPLPPALSSNLTMSWTFACHPSLPPFFPLLLYYCLSPSLLPSPSLPPSLSLSLSVIKSVQPWILYYGVKFYHPDPSKLKVDHSRSVTITTNKHFQKPKNFCWIVKF